MLGNQFKKLLIIFYLCLHTGRVTLGINLDESLILGPDSETGGRSVRQSRRIAQLKIKEQAERRQIEDVALYGLPKESKSKSKQKMSQKVLIKFLI